MDVLLLVILSISRGTVLSVVRSTVDVSFWGTRGGARVVDFSGVVEPFGGANGNRARRNRLNVVERVVREVVLEEVVKSWKNVHSTKVL